MGSRFANSNGGRNVRSYGKGEEKMRVIRKPGPSVKRPVLRFGSESSRTNEPGQGKTANRVLSARDLKKSGSGKTNESKFTMKYTCRRCPTSKRGGGGGGKKKVQKGVDETVGGKHSPGKDTHLQSSVQELS